MVPYPIFLIERGSLMIDLDGRFVLPQQKTLIQTDGISIHRHDALTHNTLKAVWFSYGPIRARY